MRDHFSQDNNGLGSPCVIRAFGNIAGGYRIVEQLRHVLRFQDPEALRPTEGEFKDDKAHLVRPMLKNLRRVLLDAIVAGDTVSLDEIDIGFDGKGQLKTQVKL